MTAARTLPTVNVVRTLFAALLGVLAINVSATPATRTVSEIAPGVFVHLGRHLALDAVGHDDIANIGFIVGTRCVAVIDSGGSVASGRALLGEIRKRTRQPVCYVINTHVHVDHVLGNAAFRGEGTHFVGHVRLADAIRHNVDFFVREYAADLDAPASEAQIIGPDRLVENTLDLDLGARKLTLRAWTTAHTDSDLTVFDHATSTLWTGDLLFRERLPALDGSARAWLGVIDSLVALEPHHAIPGHGRPTDDLANAVKPERAYLQALIDDVRRALAEGQSLQQAINNVGQAHKENWLLWDETHPRNVTRVYQELEWE